MKYGSRGRNKLKEVICENCTTKLQNWGDEVFTCWIRYINGANRKNLVKGTRFTNYTSLKYYFKYHSCYKKIAKIRKIWFRPVKVTVNVQIQSYPWLLGIFYADGAIQNETQLSFGLAIHEKVIEDRIITELKEILGKNAHIVKEKIGNMRNVRVHSVELCDAFPNKQDKKIFLKIWNSFSIKEKFEFIGGYVDGDGSCSFEYGIDSIQIFSKVVPFILDFFHPFLNNYGYLSLKNFKLYISPKVGRKIKKFTLKRMINKPYHGKVDVKKAFEMLKKGMSVNKIAKRMNLNKKTVLLALKITYGKEKLEKYYKLHRKTKKLN